MHDLRLIGVHEDGEHLLLADRDGGRYRVRIDDALRAATRRDRPRLGQLQIEIDNGVRPRDIQAMIRAGASAREVAERTGWSVERVARFEGPVLAEREHVANLARDVVLRVRGGDGRGEETLGERVGERLAARGVAADGATWDAYRGEDGTWNVTVEFAAGSRTRAARWHVDPETRTALPVDDEARWLTEDDTPAGPIPVPHRLAGPDEVFDAEAERTDRLKRHPASHDSENDLASSVRNHSGARRRARRSRGQGPARLVSVVDPPADALPLEPLATEPAGPPPAARGTHPHDEGGAAPTETGPTPSTPTPHEGAVDGPSDDDAVTKDDRRVTEGAPDDGPQETPDDRGDAAEEPAEDAADPVEELDDAAEEPAEDEDGNENGSRGRKDDPAAAETGRKRRPSVPSWDDVMFGAGRPRR